MTGELRKTLKQLVHERRLQFIQMENRLFPADEFCAGCGMLRSDGPTPGCHRCGDRERKRLKRLNDPVFRERERQRDRVRHQREAARRLAG